MKRYVTVTLPIMLILIISYFIWGNQNSGNLPKVLQLSTSLMYDQEYDSAIYYAKKVIQTAKNPNNLAYAHSIIGYSWYEKESLDSSYHHYIESLKASNQSDSIDYELRIKTLNMLGIIFEIKEMHLKAIDYFNLAIDILDRYENSNIVVIYYNLAYNQSKINDINCVKSYYKALEYASKYEKKWYESICLNDLGILMLRTENYESAGEYFEMSLKTNYTSSSKLYQAFAYQGLGEVHFHLEDLKKSENYLSDALSLQNELENYKYAFDSYIFLARICKKKGNLKVAETQYLKAIEYFPNAGHTRENIAVFKELSKLQFKLGKIEESNKNNTRHYAEIDIYLDEREKAIQLAKQDQFETTVAASEAQFRDKSKLQMLKDEMDWEVAIKVGSILSLIGLIYLAKRKITRLRTSLDINMQSIQKLRTYP